MTVQEAIQFLTTLKEGLDHEAMPGCAIALSMAIAVLKALTPEQVKTVNALYSLEFTPEIKF